MLVNSPSFRYCLGLKIGFSLETLQNPATFLCFRQYQVSVHIRSEDLLFETAASRSQQQGLSVNLGHLFLEQHGSVL